MEATGPRWTLGERLWKTRRDAGMTQEDMADLLLVSRQTVNGWENDQHRPPHRKLVAWSLRTGVDLDWITQDEPLRAPRTATRVLHFLRHYRPRYRAAKRVAVGHDGRRPPHTPAPGGTPDAGRGSPLPRSRPAADDLIGV